MAPESDRIDARVTRHYSALSAKLQLAADYVVSHPVEIATRSLRAVSGASGVSPATLSRLARAIGFSSYEEMRELSRASVNAQVLSFSDKAQQLQDPTPSDQSLLERQAGACIANISSLAHSIDQAELTRAADLLREARQVVLFGAFGSNGIAEYMSYLANFFAPNWTMADHAGKSLATTLGHLGPEDVFLVITKTPYAKAAVQSTKIAQNQGTTTIVLTDHHGCPAVPFADIAFFNPSESPQFFSSYGATIVLIEALISTIIAGSTRRMSDRIRDVETRNRSLGTFWAD